MFLQFDLRSTTRDQVVAKLRRFEKTHRSTVTRLSSEMLQVQLTPLEEVQLHTGTLQGEEQFDKKLDEAVGIINRGSTMSITGASLLGDQFRRQLAEVKDKLSRSSEKMGTAMTELKDTAVQADDMVKQVEAETADLKAALGLTSNGGPV